MRSKPSISVLLSVFNTDFHLVKRAIDSVLQQDIQDFELLIIDDGSDIMYQQQLLKYATLHENKITYLRHKNCGQSRSINRGILNSQGDFITILDADDEFKPNHLRACLHEMRYVDLIASTTETIVNEDADYYVPDKHDTSKVVHVDDCILFATLFGKKEVFTNFNFKDEYAADAHFYERAAQKYVVNKVNLRTYIYYRNSPTSICSALKKASLSMSVS